MYWAWRSDNAPAGLPDLTMVNRRQRRLLYAGVEEGIGGAVEVVGVWRPCDWFSRRILQTLHKPTQDYAQP
jgi:hypothetical protein